MFGLPQVASFLLLKKLMPNLPNLTRAVSRVVNLREDSQVVNHREDSPLEVNLREGSPLVVNEPLILAPASDFNLVASEPPLARIRTKTDQFRPILKITRFTASTAAELARVFCFLLFMSNLF